jgi:DNA-binding GntR family transcriptional regulator
MTNGLNNDDVASLTEKAYQAISTAIANLQFKPGEALKQDHLARWLSISRTPVREALRRLEQDGIIQTQPGRGLVVTELTLKDVEDMLEMLRLMDAHAAYLAARRRTSEQADRLAQVARALLAAAERHDVEAWSIADKPYHEIVLAASGNQLLRHTIEDLRRRLHRVTINSATRPERLLECTHEHLKVADAIVRGDAAAAAELMQAHIDAMSMSALALIRTYILPVRGERF